MRMGASPAHAVFPRSLSPQALRGERESRTPLTRWIPAYARYAAPDLIGDGVTLEYLPRISETGHYRTGWMCQVSLAYSAMARSLENLPILATFRIGLCAQLRESVNV
jgi:hypothetical protein